jgi:small-conductance mechanosensitive channel
MRRAAVLLCTLLLCASCSEPPQKEIDRAQGAIDAARAAGAEQYAGTEFGEATAALQQAHDAVGQRDYRLALSRALDASQRAQDAARQAADGRARARSEAESAVQASSAAIEQLEARLRGAPGGRSADAELKTARQALSAAQRTVQEASAAIRSGKYVEASAAVKNTATEIGRQIAALDEATPARTARRRR